MRKTKNNTNKDLIKKMKSKEDKRIEKFLEGVRHGKPYEIDHPFDKFKDNLQAIIDSAWEIADNNTETWDEFVKFMDLTPSELEKQSWNSAFTMKIYLTKKGLAK